jgi:hypothetical protein
MPNLDLDKKGTFVVVPEEFKKFFKEDKISYTNLTTKKDRLESELTKNPSDVEKKKLLDWINRKLETETKKVDAPKRSRMNIEAEGSKQGKNGNNNYKRRDATKVQEIGSVVAVSESEIQKEINSMKYLIEYMDNNKNKI